MRSENTISFFNPIHKDLLAFKTIYDKFGIILADPKAEVQNAPYGACSFYLNGLVVQHRVAKITPIKCGQFVTLWKRNANGATQPFDITDNIDLIIITTRSGPHLGQFIFPKKIIIGKGIISGNNQEGKRGFRVYPPWDIVTSFMAQKTQKWQSEYFVNITDEDNSFRDFFKHINLNSSIHTSLPPLQTP